MKYFIAILSVFIFSFTQAKGKTCTYEFDVENSKIEGTGYKYTEKTGVAGSFRGITLNKTEKKAKAKELLTDLEVKVDLMTLDSGNSLRDKNMRETLFANILGDSVVTVTVKKVTEKKLETEFKLNEKTQAISFDYQVKEDEITAKGVFDVMKFAMGDQVAALKKRCGSLHTGSDGKSVTWSDFALSVTAKLKKVCK